MDVRDFKNIQIVFATSGTADATMKIAGSFVDKVDDVDFATAAGINNEWDFLATFNLQNPTSVIAGDTGIIYAGTDAVEQVLVNVDGVNFVTVNVTARSAGTLDATLVGYSND